jgi:hypothetical protein
MTAPSRGSGAVPPLVLLVLAPLLTAIAACGPQPVSPLPTLGAGRPAGGPTGSPVVARAPSVARSARGAAATTAAPAPYNPPPPPLTTTTTPTPSVGPSTSTVTSAGPCWGIVEYELNVQEIELALVRPMCLRVGSILRLRGTGPGLVTSEPDTVASQSYEGGVEEIRFVRAGTATVRIPQNDQVHTITVVVVS